MISPRTLRSLAEPGDDDAFISIFLPTTRLGTDTDQGSIRLGNLTKQAASLVEARGGSAEPALARLSDAVAELRGDSRFWSHQTSGLALLAGPEGVRALHLDSAPREFAYVGPRFCVRPLLPSVASPASFFVLSLSQHSVRLFEADREHIRELRAHEIPATLADAMGHDWEQPSLQFHTGAAPVGAAGSARAATFHGQGRAKDTSDDELREFIRRVASGLDAFLADEKAPLVLAGVDHETAALRRSSGYAHIVERTVSGNQEHVSDHQLHASALAIAEPHLRQAEQRELDRLAAIGHSRRERESGISRVLPAAANSRLSALFLRPEEPIWGRFASEAAPVEVHGERRPTDDDLLDLAVSLTLASGGEVIPTSANKIPGDSTVAGITRF